MKNAIFEIFKAGNHTDSNGKKVAYPLHKLEETVQAYNNGAETAPLVIGHPTDNRPQYGEVKKLILVNNSLFAECAINEELTALIKKGSYKKISASFIKNHQGESYKLNHVGFLGAAPPAIKGMKSAEKSLSFNEEIQSEIIFFNESNSEEPPETESEKLHRTIKTIQAHTGQNYTEIFNLLTR